MPSFHSDLNTRIYFTHGLGLQVSNVDINLGSNMDVNWVNNIGHRLTREVHIDIGGGQDNQWDDWDEVYNEWSNNGAPAA